VGAVKAVQLAVGVQVHLGGDFRSGVRGLRVHRLSFADRQRGRRAVDGPARGREDDLASAGHPGGLGEVDRAEDVLPDVEQRVGDAHPDVDLRGQVEDHLGRRVTKHRAEPGVQDVDFPQLTVGR
jgi:hypothetical protein